MREGWEVPLAMDAMQASTTSTPALAISQMTERLHVDVSWPW